MANDNWGPWIGWNGGECPVDVGTEVELAFANAVGLTETGPEGWNWDSRSLPIVAYRVKKGPVVESRKVWMRSTSGVGMEDVLCQCTYTDGKLTSIHWEHPDA